MQITHTSTSKWLSCIRYACGLSCGTVSLYFSLKHLTKSVTMCTQLFTLLQTNPSHVAEWNQLNCVERLSAFCSAMSYRDIIAYPCATL